jgi:hypothetical protein
MGWHHTHHECRTADCLIPQTSGRCPGCEREARQIISDARLDGDSIAASAVAAGIVPSLLYGDIDRDHLRVLQALAGRIEQGRVRHSHNVVVDPDKWGSMDWRRVAYRAMQAEAEPTQPKRRALPVDAFGFALRIHAELLDGATFADLARRWYMAESTLRGLYGGSIDDLRSEAARANQTLPEADIRRGRPRKTAQRAHKGAGAGNANPPAPQPPRRRRMTAARPPLFPKGENR